MLDSEQIGFFKANGYLLVPGVMDKQLCSELQDRMWESLPKNASLKREVSATHIGPFGSDLQSAESIDFRDGYRWLNRKLGVVESAIQLIYSEEICEMARQLIGGDLRQAVVEGKPMGASGPAWPGGPTDPALGTEGARGVYFTLPYGDKPREPDLCHTDGHPFQLGVVGLIADTPEDGGAFKVWPGSHKSLFSKFVHRYDQPRIPYYDHLPAFKGISHTPEYLKEIVRLNKEVKAVECWGQSGDLVFWHHRTAHMAGHNYSNTIREAILADFWNDQLNENRTKPSTHEMWDDWTDEVKNSSEEYSIEFAREQRLEV